MDSQKIENLLNLSLSVDAEEREQSPLLREGFDLLSDTWEIIIKYQGDIERYASDVIIIEPLIAGYAIVTLPDTLLDDFVALPEIEYVEKPKPFYFQDITALRESCISTVTDREPFLTGKGVLVAILDSSIDFYNENFRNGDGSSRIEALWDQSLAPDAELGRVSPEGFQTGVEFTKEQIDAALSLGSEAEARRFIPTVDVSGHGTAVAGILAAGGTAEEPFRKGVAPEASLLIVKLGAQRENAFPRTTEIMRGVTYALRKARELQMPLVINLSFGNTYGDHRGNSLLERFLDNAAEIGRTSVVVGSGNEGASGGHVEGLIKEKRIERIELSVADYERTLNVQLWKYYQDVFDVTLITPRGERIEIPMNMPGAFRYRTEGVTLLVYVGQPLPYMVFQEVYIDFIPEERIASIGFGVQADNYIMAGIWTFELIPRNIVYGGYQFFLPSGSTRNEGTRFFRESPQVTLTVPSTASRVITVGAYDIYTGGVADFSGRGYVFRQLLGNRSNGVEGGFEQGVADGVEVPTLIDTVKPDLVAPGVDIETVSVRGGYTRVSGTSYATPMVAGAAALLMEWGIVQGNDPYLYGEKLKAYLIKGAKTIPGEEDLPDDRAGWGALCLADSIP
ncbi:MAG: S8 family serine peptidase [Lachnospiraceae bacterium]|nr:S8 family serine peptidase [Lachnospiraceae bacterium]